MKQVSKAEIKKQIEQKLSGLYSVSHEDADKVQMYKAVCLTIREILGDERLAYQNKVKKEQAKQVYYLSMEFLLGRSLKNNLFNMGLTATVTQAVKELGFDIAELYDIEPDAGLGNGGLGRLAAAYLDSLTSCRYPAGGFSILYDYGIFAQKIVDGWQMEMPDKWLTNGSVWIHPRDNTYEVRFNGHVEEHWDNGRLVCEHKDYTPIMAIGYEMPISGYGCKAVNFLRLWSAKTRDDIDMQLFASGQFLKAVEAKAMAEAISRVLYPADNNYEGKSLRLKQQYFFVSASVQCIIRHQLRTYSSLDNLADKVSMHINDTHPALIIPELMRIFLDDYGYSWDKAWDIVCKTVSYTNHTVLSEALEKWPEHLYESLLPRIYQIVKEINRRYCGILWNAFPNDWNRVSKNAIIANGEIRMANMCLAASHAINGVSALHTEILKDDVFADYYKIAPQKFFNVTNGITYRRWLAQANPELTALITDLIGDKFLSDPNELDRLTEFCTNKPVIDKIFDIKRRNKEKLAQYIKQTTDISVSPDAVFDVQVKRLHEYKRQLLNCFHIIDLYRRIKENPSLEVNPRVFIFGAKAAGSYYMAKLIIKLIWFLGELINNDPDVRGKIKVVFLENYRVTLAEMIMPASDVSEQISTAGKEASGTGNMKFMLNGAVTIGTMDGANVEIHQHVGDDNIFIFGLLTEEVNRLVGNYAPALYYSNDSRIRYIIDLFRGGIKGEPFKEIADSLLTGGKPDSYLVLADFASYIDAQNRVDAAYSDRYRWGRMSVMNTARSGFFASDRSIEEYAQKIWRLTKC
ncbi:MAG: glycogen/starch/alpha-glucan phosphorylase [Christensenellaceae bacterium]|jgi:starch phosphorylase|nr:glycogen/starch/alpha-glucan phosphorylase [Christensenellaceae bacterium]